jgi:RNA-directed DNA polymerase
MTENDVLINLRRIPIVRHPKLQISKNPFLNKEYSLLLLKKLKLHSSPAA